MAAQPRPAAVAPAGYFVDQRKGEVNELKMLLKNISVERDQKRKRDIIKKVIAYMTLGIDVSRLFSDMIMAIETRDIVVKKMAYLYLCNYAHKQPELAIMCINTLTRDCQNEDPMIRGLALRSLSSLRLPSMVEYISKPLQHCMQDLSAYVRKTAAMGVLKLYHLNPETVKNSDFIPALQAMLDDVDANVVTNAIMALNEILAESGGIEVTQRLILTLLNRIAEFNEWGLDLILDLVAKYTPENDDEAFAIMNLLDPLLRTTNTGAVLSTIRCFLHLVHDMPEFQQQVYERCKAPILTLMAGGTPEIVYALLKHLEVMIPRCDGTFDDEFHQLFIRYNEPSYVKHLKADILPLVANGSNAAVIAAELGEYVVDVDAELSRRSIQAIGKIAMRVPVLAVDMIQRLIELMDLDIAYVRAEAVNVMKDLIRLYPDMRGHFFPYLPRCLKQIDEVEPRVALIWMLGEFGNEITEAPYLLEPIIDRYDEEAPQIKLELLSSSMKLFFQRPPEMQAMLGRLLVAATNDVNNQDVHDRALLYYRLLTTQPSVGEVVFKDGTAKQPCVSFAEERDQEHRDEVFREFGTLAILFDQPSHMFVQSEYLIKSSGPEFEIDRPNGHQDDVFSDDGDSHGPQPVGAVNLLGDDDDDDGRHHAPASNSGGGLISFDLLGGDEPVSPPAGQAMTLREDFVLDSSTFQGQWGALPDTLNSTLCVLSRLPAAPAEVEGVMRANHIKTMASGNLDAVMKIFFYAGDTNQTLYLIQMIIDKSSGAVQVTVKVGNASAPAEAAARIADVLRSSLAAYL